MQPDSPLMRLARITLKRDPVEWIERMRHADMTWQAIADELSARLDVPISRETVRLWAQTSADEQVAS